MKKFSILSAAIDLLSSCSSINQIITIDDEFKNEKSIRLIQKLDGYSDEKRRNILGADYIINLKTLYLNPEDREGIVTAELTVETHARPEDLDSLIFIGADNEKHQFISNEYAKRLFVNRSSSTSTSTSVEKKEGTDKNNKTEKTSTTTQTTTSDQTLQVMKRTIEIPRDLWEQFSQATHFKFRFYIESEGVTIRFTSRGQKKFAELFNAILEFEKSQGTL